MGEVGGLASDLSLEFRIIPKTPNALRGFTVQN